MGIQGLERIFSPQRIALVGATDRPRSVGSAVMGNLIGSGFRGVVYPVNPNRESVHGVAAFPSIASLPHPPDLAVLCIPAKHIPAQIRECGKAGVGGLVILSAGFGETGPEGKRLEQEALAEAAKFKGMRIIGPNCLGIMVPGLNLNASFAAGMPAKGGIAFLSQSGALCTSVLDWALDAGVGFSYFVSVGNAADATFGDLIDFVAQDPATKSIILYVESVRDARRFVSAARSFARSKPIIAFKSGRHEASAKAASSHTGALAGADDVYNAAFRRAGIERVYEIGDMFECAALLSNHRAPRGGRLAIVTNAGGPGVMATDALIDAGGTPAELSPETMEALNEFLPAAWSHGNPIDILGDAEPERYARACETVLKDPAVDAALVVLSPQAMTDPSSAARAVAGVSTKSTKPILSAWIGGASVRSGAALLERAGVPSYRTPEDAIDAFMHLANYARNLDVLYETPREVPVGFKVDRNERRKPIEGPDGKAGMLDEVRAKRVLADYGFGVAEAHPARTAADAVARANEIGYPVVLKVHAEAISHKSDVGGVALNLHNEQEVRTAYLDILKRTHESRPEALVDGVTVQRMVDTRDSVELIVGAKRDPVFGTVLLVGLGGTQAELWRDTAVELPPLNERLARRMLESLKSYPLLTGFRGKPMVDMDAVIAAIIRASYLVAEHPEITELDINPLVVSPTGVVALDARLAVDPEAGKVKHRYDHLSIRPVPEGITFRESLRDGTPITLRPIRPEDEPLWHEMVAAGSPESMRLRFGGMVDASSHRLGTRYTVIDYDREIAFVAELEVNGERKFAGVTRIVAEPGGNSAELAVFVADPWQGQGLGRILAHRGVELAERWGFERLHAVTDRVNDRAIAMLREAGFHFRGSAREDDRLYGERELHPKPAPQPASAGV